MTGNQPHILLKMTSQIFFCNFYNNMREARKKKRKKAAGIRLVFAGTGLQKQQPFL